MAKVDFNSLNYDTLIGRKRQVCGKCGNLMAVTTICPMRENRTVTVKEGFKKVKKKLSPIVCWHCCHKCGYAVDTPLGKACGVKLNRNKKEEQQRQAEKEAKRKAKKRDVREASPYEENSMFEEM